MKCADCKRWFAVLHDGDARPRYCPFCASGVLRDVVSEPLNAAAKREEGTET